jgi:hypothetical protein
VYILESIHIVVMCVIKDSNNRELWRNINVYILGSVHIPVMCVIRDSRERKLW